MGRSTIARAKRPYADLQAQAALLNAAAERTRRGISARDEASRGERIAYARLQLGKIELNAALRRLYNQLWEAFDRDPRQAEPFFDDWTKRKSANRGNGNGDAGGNGTAGEDAPRADVTAAA